MGIRLSGDPKQQRRTNPIVLSLPLPQSTTRDCDFPVRKARDSHTSTVVMLKTSRFQGSRYKSNRQ